MVILDNGERQRVERAVRSSDNSPRKHMRTGILLDASDPTNLTDVQIATKMGTKPLTRIRMMPKGYSDSFGNGFDGSYAFFRTQVRARPTNPARTAPTVVGSGTAEAITPAGLVLR